jgi:hypothetical protein
LLLPPLLLLVLLLVLPLRRARTPCRTFAPHDDALAAAAADALYGQCGFYLHRLSLLRLYS